MSSTKRCPKCNTLLNKHIKKCVKCGYLFKNINNSREDYEREYQKEYLQTISDLKNGTLDRDYLKPKYNSIKLSHIPYNSFNEDLIRMICQKWRNDYDFSHCPKNKMISLLDELPHSRVKNLILAVQKEINADENYKYYKNFNFFENVKYLKDDERNSRKIIRSNLKSLGEEEFLELCQKLNVPTHIYSKDDKINYLVANRTSGSLISTISLVKLIIKKQDRHVLKNVNVYNYGQNSRMKECNSCHKPVAKTAKVCPYCGNDLSYSFLSDHKKNDYDLNVCKDSNLRKRQLELAKKYNNSKSIKKLEIFEKDNLINSIDCSQVLVETNKEDDEPVYMDEGVLKRSSRIEKDIIKKDNVKIVNADDLEVDSKKFGKSEKKAVDNHISSPKSLESKPDGVIYNFCIYCGHKLDKGFCTNCGTNFNTMNNENIENELITIKKYDEMVDQLNNLFDAKEGIVTDLIKEYFPPPQLSYDRFMNEVQITREIFNKYSHNIKSKIRVAKSLAKTSYDMKKVKNELDLEINNLNKIIEKFDALITELIINLNSSETSDNELENLFEDIERLTNSVKDYK